ncbi:MAG: hypothetical protein K5634_01830, partial [Sphaerochaetaceae bacterium]|nr:hypothetical protein [Sphaerochaetaceae bacterium]
MNKYKNLLIITIIAVILIPVIISCQNEVSQGVYIPDDIWMVNGKTYYAFSEAMAALESGKDSKAIDETNTIRLLRDVGEFERGEGIVVPESYTGEIEINLGGYEYWFQDDIEYFLEIKGGTAVNIVNGTTVISEDANIIPKALIVNTEVVKLEDQKIDDRRPTPQAIEIQSKGIVEISSGTEISGDITVSGGGQLGVKGGSLSSSN